MQKCVYLDAYKNTKLALIYKLSAEMNTNRPGTRKLHRINISN